MDPFCCVSEFVQDIVLKITTMKTKLRFSISRWRPLESRRLYTTPGSQRIDTTLDNSAGVPHNQEIFFCGGYEYSKEWARTLSDFVSLLGMNYWESIWIMFGTLLCPFMPLWCEPFYITVFSGAFDCLHWLTAISMPTSSPTFLFHTYLVFLSQLWIVCTFITIWLIVYICISFPNLKVPKGQ